MTQKLKNKTKHKPMDKLHQKLASKSSWYANWHKEPTAQTFHWVAFGVVVLLVGAIVINSIDPFLGGLQSRAAVTLPEPPRVYLTTTVDSTTTQVAHATINVPAGGDLQAAINSAALGDEIVLTAGATYTAPLGPDGFILRNKTTGSGWITIRTSNMAGISAEGTRITPANATAMPKIVSSGVETALRTEDGAHNYRLIGVEITNPTFQTYPDHAIVALGESSQTTLAAVPHDIILDRVYIHGHPNIDVQRCIALNSSATAIVDSYIADCHGTGYDSQAIAGWNGPGPFKIVNNYLEGAGENVMFGGSPAAIPNLTASDIEFRRNYVKKPLSWYFNDPSYIQPVITIPNISSTAHWTVKNLFELKNARRVLVEGNVFENNWADAQAGWAIQFTPRPSDSGTWAAVEDVDFRNNIVRNSGAGVNILGHDQPPAPTDTRLRRLRIANNLFDNINGPRFGSNGVFLTITAGAEDVTAEHNTVFHTGNIVSTDYDPPNPRFVYRYNISRHNAYGIFGRGIDDYSYHLPDAVVTGNVIAKEVDSPSNIESMLPSGNFFPASMQAVGFVDLAGGNYRLSDASLYKGAGVDFAALDAALAGSTPPTPAPEPTPTPTIPKSHLSLSPSSVSFSAISGEAAPAAKVVTLSNTGSASSNWNGSTDQSWCHLAPVSGTLASGGQAGLSVSVDDPSNIGTFFCSIRISDTNADNSPQTIAVSYTVTGAVTNQTPSITSFNVSSKSSTSAVITWTTNQATTGIVKYGTVKTNLNLPAADNVSKATHTVTLNNLTFKSTYYYQITATNANGIATTLIASFRTKPDPNSNK